MVRAGPAIANADGAEEHELDEIAPLQDHRQTQTVDVDPHLYPDEAGYWPGEEADNPQPNPPPQYQAAPEQNRPGPRRWPQPPINLQDQLAQEQRRRRYARMNRQARAEEERARSWARWEDRLIRTAAFIVLFSLVSVGVWYLLNFLAGKHHDDTKDPQVSPKVSLRHIPRKTSVTTLSTVPGLYIIPSSVSYDTWLRLDNGSSKSGHWNESLKSPTDSKTSSAFHSLGHRQDSRIFVRHEVGNGSAIVERQEQGQFEPWGVEVLYNLYPRATIHTMQVKKGWCINHTCSIESKLNALCNDTGKDPKKIKKKNHSQQKECDWCWNEALFPRQNRTQQAKIERHCEKVAHHAAVFLTYVCGIFLFFMLLLTILLITRMLLRTKMARVAPYFEPNAPGMPAPYDGSGENGRRKIATAKMRLSNLFRRGRRITTSDGNPSQMQLQSKGSNPKGVFSRTGQTDGCGERIFVLPPAKDQRDHAKMKRPMQANGEGIPEATFKDQKHKFLRRSGAYSSGSQHIPMDTLNRQSYLAEQEEYR